MSRRVIDFTEGGPEEFGTGTQRVMSKKQIRARARRNQKISEAELEKLYKPIEQWDDEELARGRPRSSDGSFRGAQPRWISRQIHEQAMARFKGVVEGKMRQETITALQVVHSILDNDLVDDKGRALVSAATKLEAAKFLIEHAVGKPTQRQEVDISVRLQALLASATAGPWADGADALALPPGADYEAAFGLHAIDDETLVEDDDIEDAEVVE